MDKLSEKLACGSKFNILLMVPMEFPVKTISKMYD